MKDPISKEPATLGPFPCDLCGIAIAKPGLCACCADRLGRGDVEDHKKIVPRRQDPRWLERENRYGF